jgi:hypothetical protein
VKGPAPHSGFFFFPTFAKTQKNREPILKEYGISAMMMHIARGAAQGPGDTIYPTHTYGMSCSIN